MTWKLFKLRITGYILMLLIRIRNWNWISKLLVQRKAIIAELVEEIEKQKQQFKDE